METKISYKPFIQRVPMGYQGLVGVYENGKYYSHYVNDDSVYDSEIVALHHAQAEIVRYEKEDGEEI